LRVQKKILIAIAGIVWLLSGSMLISFTFKWFLGVDFFTLGFLLIAGALLGFAKAKLVFEKYTKKNIARILGFENPKQSVFRFMPLSSYLMIAVMSGGGSMLRKSGIVPKEVLIPLYFGIGLALILSSFGYFRHLRHIKSVKED